MVVPNPAVRPLAYNQRFNCIRTVYIFLLFSTQCTRQTVVCTRESLETDTRYGAARKRRRVNGRGPALTVSPALYVESAASS